MVKVMYNNKLVYKLVIWAFLGNTLWKEKIALIINYSSLSVVFGKYNTS